MVNTLFILLTTLNALGKQAAFNMKSARMDHIIDIINGWRPRCVNTTKYGNITRENNIKDISKLYKQGELPRLPSGYAYATAGPQFAPTKPYHVEVMQRNAVVMARLLKIYHAAALSCASMWAIFPFVNRALGQDVQFTGYIPFDTTTSPAFEIALVYMSVLIAVQAYGNVTLDCTIVAFYAQAKTQILILRYNLEQLMNAEGDDKNNSNLFERSIMHTSYKDNEEGNDLEKRFSNCVKHYQLIAWFTKEVESIFGEAMVVQFFVMSWVICMTVYKIIGLNILSAEFVSMIAYLGCMLAQLFIYCYFGTHLKDESEFVNQSMYFSDWLSVSPRFRRQLLVMMQYCSRPLAPRTAYIIPMSLETYIAVLKSSYTLFAFLNRN